MDVEIPSPDPRAADGEIFAQISIEVALPEDDYPHEDVTLEFCFADRWTSSQLRWHLTVQVLATVSPPEADRDPFGGIYSNLLEPGALAHRLREVRAFRC